MADMFIGTSKIGEEKTLENGLIEVTLLEPQGQPPVILLTTAQLEAVKSEVPYPDGEVSLKKWKLTVAKVINTFVEDNMQLIDRSFVMDRIDEAVKSMYQKAVAKKFEVDYVEKIALKTLVDMVD